MTDGGFETKSPCLVCVSYHELFLFYVLNFLKIFLYRFSVMTGNQMGVGGGVYSDEGFDGFTFFTFVVILLQRKLVNRCRAAFILQFHQICFSLLQSRNVLGTQCTPVTCQKHV